MKATMADYLRAHQPCTTQQIAKSLGRARQSVIYRHKLKEIYISEWRRDPRHKRLVAYYSLGNAPDAKKPVYSNTVIATRWVGGRYPGA